MDVFEELHVVNDKPIYPHPRAHKYWEYYIGLNMYETPNIDKIPLYNRARIEDHIKNKPRMRKPATVDDLLPNLIKDFETIHRILGKNKTYREAYFCEFFAFNEDGTDVD